MRLIPPYDTWRCSRKSPSCWHMMDGNRSSVRGMLPACKVVYVCTTVLRGKGSTACDEENPSVGCGRYRWYVVWPVVRRSNPRGNGGAALRQGRIELCTSRRLPSSDISVAVKTVAGLASDLAASRDRQAVQLLTRDSWPGERGPRGWHRTCLGWRFEGRTGRARHLARYRA